jgi:Nucleotide modification associated domain 2
MPSSSPTLYSYVLRYDSGAAPNPYWGICTLVICKPKIREKAKQGDWIVGLGSKSNSKMDYGGKIVFVMKVTRTMTMEAYDSYTNQKLPNKIPVGVTNHSGFKRDSRKWRLRLGDSIYDYCEKGIRQRGVHKRKNRITDRNGRNALLSREFVYFGDQAICLPKSLEGILHKGRGHRSLLNQKHLPAFLHWWKTNEREFAKKRVRGVPQKDVFANPKNVGECAETHKKEAEEDNRIDSLSPQR